MTDGPDASEGWFTHGEPGDVDQAGAAINERTGEEPRDWPQRAVDAGYAESEADYYDRLHEATIHAIRQRIRARERADDRQLVHAVRAMDDRSRFLVY